MRKSVYSTHTLVLSISPFSLNHNPCAIFKSVTLPSLSLTPGNTMVYSSSLVLLSGRANLRLDSVSRTPDAGRLTNIKPTVLITTLKPQMISLTARSTKRIHGPQSSLNTFLSGAPVAVAVVIFIVPILCEYIIRSSITVYISPFRR